LLAIPTTGRGRTIYEPQSLYEDALGFDTGIYTSVDDVNCVGEVLPAVKVCPFMLMGWTGFRGPQIYNRVMYGEHPTTGKVCNIAQTPPVANLLERQIVLRVLQIYQGLSTTVEVWCSDVVVRLSHAAGQRPLVSRPQD